MYMYMSWFFQWSFRCISLVSPSCGVFFNQLTLLSLCCLPWLVVGVASLSHSWLATGDSGSLAMGKINFKIFIETCTNLTWKKCDIECSLVNFRTYRCINEYQLFCTLYGAFSVCYIYRQCSSVLYYYVFHCVGFSLRCELLRQQGVLSSLPLRTG